MELERTEALVIIKCLAAIEEILANRPEHRVLHNALGHIIHDISEVLTNTSPTASIMIQEVKADIILNCLLYKEKLLHSAKYDSLEALEALPEVRKTLLHFLPN